MNKTKLKAYISKHIFFICTIPLIIVLTLALVALWQAIAGVDKEIIETKGKIADYTAQIEAAESREQSATARAIPLAAKVNPTAKPQKTTSETVETVEWRYELTDEEIRLIACMAEREDYTSHESMAACAEVVLNRVESEKFKDTVYDVLYTPKQFAVMKRIKADTKPSEEAEKAVLAVFRDGESYAPGALFFAEKSVKPSKIAKKLYEAARYGSTVYYGQR